MLRKYIKESFFNPILHVLPIVVFLLTEDFYGPEKAWIFSISFATILTGYVFIAYRSIFRWYLVSMLVYIISGIIVSYLHSLNIPAPYERIMGESVASLFMILLLLFKKEIQQLIISFSNKKLSMKNNINELIRITKAFVSIFALFSVSYISVFLFTEKQSIPLKVVYYTYIILIILISIYETIRVFAVRDNLLKEEWLPIVNEHGQEIGSINYQTSLNNEQKKFMHPVVRMIIIENNRIFLQKRIFLNDQVCDRWDNAVCLHVRLKESVSDCLKRSVSETSDDMEIKPFFLANYQIENSCEYQYVHLFIACHSGGGTVYRDEERRGKWWTIRQINEELDSGIFTENFLKEYELLIRSGLIASGRCQCDCRLREEVGRRIVISD